ncbi:protein of unknown function (plasmid) [Nitratireductor aquimarinus]
MVASTVPIGTVVWAHAAPETKRAVKKVQANRPNALGDELIVAALLMPVFVTEGSNTGSGTPPRSFSRVDAKTCVTVRFF